MSYPSLTWSTYISGLGFIPIFLIHSTNNNTLSYWPQSPWSPLPAHTQDSPQRAVMSRKTISSPHWQDWPRRYSGLTSCFKERHCEHHSSWIHRKKEQVRWCLPLFWGVVISHLLAQKALSAHVIDWEKMAAWAQPSARAAPSLSACLWFDFCPKLFPVKSEYLALLQLLFSRETGQRLWAY